MTATPKSQKLPPPYRAMSAWCANTSICCVKTSAILVFSKSATGDSPVETLRDRSIINSFYHCLAKFLRGVFLSPICRRPASFSYEHRQNRLRLESG